MIHSFDGDIAKQYGINAAILLQNIFYWLEKNKANEKHFHDGHYWTYNSVKAFEAMFPYMTGKQIRTALELLVSEGLILKGNYNSSPYDRTSWYALTEKGNALFLQDNSICPDGQMKKPQLANESAFEGEPIPDIKPNSKTDIEPDNTYVCPKPETSSAAGHKNGCAATPPVIVITLTLNDKTEYGISDLDVKAWEEIYPAVDVMQELRKMKGWCSANPGRRKTKKGIKRFINAWLAKEQDKYHKGGSANGRTGRNAETPGPDQYTEEFWKQCGIGG